MVSFFQNKKQPVQVRIVPSVHDIENINHAAVIHFIQTLPKNTKLGIELTSEEYNFATSIFQRGWNFQFRMPNALVVPIDDPNNHLSGLDLVSECVVRNLQIIPLEVTLPKLNYKSNDEDLARQILREQAFAREIARHFREGGKKQLVVIVGASHAWPLHDCLQELGLKSEFAFDAFSFVARKYTENLCFHADALREAELTRASNTDKLKKNLGIILAEGRTLFRGSRLKELWKKISNKGRQDALRRLQKGQHAEDKELLLAIKQRKQDEFRSRSIKKRNSLLERLKQRIKRTKMPK